MSFARCLLAAAVYGGALPSGMAERKRERGVWSHRQRERKQGEKLVGPVTVINLGPT